MTGSLPQSDSIPAVVGPEVALSEPRYVAAPKDQEDPDIATGSSGFLAVWRDDRPGYQPFGSGPHIYATRLSSTGEVLDPPGIVVADVSGAQWSPAVAWGEHRYLVVWQQVTGGDTAIYGARLDESGRVLDPEGFAISAAAGEQREPEVAFDGQNFLVVWGDARSGTDEDIFGARVSAAGEVLDPSGFVIGDGARGQFGPDISAASESLLVAWSDTRSFELTGSDIYASRVTSTGRVLDPEGIRVSAADQDQQRVSLASNGESWLVAWDDIRNLDNGFDVYSTRVSSSGGVAEPTGIPLPAPDTPSWQYDPAVVWDEAAATYLVGWEDLRNWRQGIRAIRVSPTGQPLDTEGALVESSEWVMQPALAVGEQGPIAVFPEHNDDTYWMLWWKEFDIRGVRVTDGGPVAPSSEVSIISQAANFQAHPEGDFGDGRMATAWLDDRSAPEPDVYAAMFSGDAERQSPDVQVTSGDRSESTSDVARGGGVSLVVWKEGASLLATRLSATGEILDPTPIVLSRYEAKDYASVAWNGTEFLVAWEGQRWPYNTGHDIFGARVTSTGHVLDPSGFVIANGDGYERRPSVASDGTNFLVIWEGSAPLTSPAAGQGAILGARVTPAGTVLDPGGFVVAQWGGSGRDPDVAWDGTQYLVAWSDGRANPTTETFEAYLDIYAARVSSAGSSLDCEGFPVTTAPGPQQEPSVAPLGDGTLVVWNEGPWSGERDVAGARVSSAGEVVDPGGFPIAASRSSEHEARAVPSGAEDRATVLYQRLAPEYPYHWAYRIFARRIEAAQPAPPSTVRPPSPCPSVTEPSPTPTPTVTPTVDPSPTDPSPSPTPSPTAGPTPTPSPSPTPTPSPTVTPSPTPTPTLLHERSISLSLRRHLIARGAVKVDDGYRACVRNVRVKIQRRADGRWATIKRTLTDNDGRYRVRVADQQGTYRTVSPRLVRGANGEHICRKSRSVRRQHSH